MRLFSLAFDLPEESDSLFTFPIAGIRALYYPATEPDSKASQEDVGLSDLYIRRILPVRPKHSISICYADVPQDQWSYSMLWPEGEGGRGEARRGEGEANTISCVFIHGQRLAALHVCISRLYLNHLVCLGPEQPRSPLSYPFPVWGRPGRQTDWRSSSSAHSCPRSRSGESAARLRTRTPGCFLAVVLSLWDVFTLHTFKIFW